MGSKFSLFSADYLGGKMNEERSREEERALIIAVIVSEREYSANITSAVLRNEPLMEKVVRISEMEYREEGK